MDGLTTEKTWMSVSSFEGSLIYIFDTAIRDVTVNTAVIWVVASLPGFTHEEPRQF